MAILYSSCQKISFARAPINVMYPVICQKRQGVLPWKLYVMDTVIVQLVTMKSSVVRCKDYT